MKEKDKSEQLKKTKTKLLKVTVINPPTREEAKRKIEELSIKINEIFSVKGGE